MSKINTLGSLKGGEGSGNSSGEDSDEGRQGFFVGGSERSGQQVLGPNENERAAERLFEAVRRAGAEEVSPEEAARLNDPTGGSNYRGGAYRLGDNNEAARPAPEAPQAEDPNAPARVRVLLWENGFSLDDGPLRSYEVPESRAFLMALQAGSIPRELQTKYRGRPVDIHMEQKKSPFVPPKAKPFATQGLRLGSIVPEVITIDSDQSSSSAPVADKKLTGDESKKLLEEAQKAVNVQNDKPKGQIQIRQPNGERLIGEFNASHTVEDVRSFIVAALPDYAFQPFILQNSYPKKTIEDEKQTVEQAGIFKALVLMIKN